MKKIKIVKSTFVELEKILYLLWGFLFITHVIIFIIFVLLYFIFVLFFLEVIENNE
jgi:hypothetical protein